MRSGGARTDEGCYEAVASRDARFDGTFYFAVTTTGIYCRPSCPAGTPKRTNVRFFPTAAAAHGAGFRACRRCRPDAVPGSAEWDLRADVVGRAMRLIGDGVVDREGVAGLAARLGYSARQLHRHLTAEVGAGPLALARARRAHTARLLLQTTALPATEVAFAAGFASVRQFNDTIRTVYAATPLELRGPRARRTARPAPSGHDRVGPGGRPDEGGLTLRLGYRRPYEAGHLFDYLAVRALPGAEEVVGERGRRTYRRTLRLAHGHGIAAVAERPTGDDAGWLDCRLILSDLRDLGSAVSRIRRLFDLDADPLAVADRLAGDPALAAQVGRLPGLRAPGAADPHELAVRAVLGQQVSVAAGRRLGAALLAAYGDPLPTPSGGLTLLFPRVGTLASAGLAELGMPAARRDAVRTLAGALEDGFVVLDAGVDRDEAQRTLLALRGIGPWTAGYLRMRALGDPDVLPPGDAALRAADRRGDVDLGRAAAWAPWRSYAAHHVWAAAATRGAPPRLPTRVSAPVVPARAGARRIPAADPVPGPS
ncbi:helix-turn-helix domain-containing protein [Frankia sp. AiPs1]|uniref:AlkA N-terminal domain-containing protein n=1 Tax=Frankia sp. AiPs1 TaxID=573493 RepID=UPI0020446B6B|nr:AlkA N-terminal domain-containing protein [Frankia sp. AiPs1]MCM3922318.1 helix-turn-helix domain-containing protein [Frankia sp. AiPs1]